MINYTSHNLCGMIQKKHIVVIKSNIDSSGVTKKADLLVKIEIITESYDRHCKRNTFSNYWLSFRVCSDSSI